MQARVQKWGNSLALRIPKSFAAEVGLSEGSPVNLSVVRGKLIVQRMPEQPPTLEQLVAGITEENRHGETDWGRPAGREAW